MAFAAIALVASGCGAATSPEDAQPVAESTVPPATSEVAEGHDEDASGNVEGHTLDTTGGSQPADAESPSGQPTDDPLTDSAPSATPSPQASTSPAPTPSPQASEPDGGLGTPLPAAPTGLEALDELAAATGPMPVAIEIESIGVNDATIIPVGVNPDETFEVPPADEVGWYRFGPTPGAEGSAVLAAHIAFDGVDGVFRYLSDVEVGSIVRITFDDGTSQRYRIDSVVDYVKEELPAELFARDGEPQLALITCGGTFNPQLRSYESNTVAVATPID